MSFQWVVRSGEVSGEGESGHPIRVVAPDFYTMVVSEDVFFFDHSEALSVFLEHGSDVHLLTCPRRFGKTTLCRMVAAFCDVEAAEQYRDLFPALAIGDHQAFLDRHQGRYPVLHLSFKDTFAASYDAFLVAVARSLSQVVQQHPRFGSEEGLGEWSRDFLRRCAYMGLHVGELDGALAQLLSILSESYGGKRVILILDEYDKPFLKAFDQPETDRLATVSFMERFLGMALKDQPNLERAFITGVMRVSLDSLFSGVNQAAVFTVNDEDNPYQSFLGFPEDVVEALVIKQLEYDPSLMVALKYWYNGYRFGRLSGRYNPWSVMQCMSRHGQLQAYWVRSGDTRWLEQAIDQLSDPVLYRQLMTLVSREPVDVLVARQVTFQDLSSHRSAVWALLLQSGYVTVCETRREGMVTVRIPNHEVWLSFQAMVSHWLGDRGVGSLPALVDCLVHSDMKRFFEILTQCLEEAMSFRDWGPKAPERVYHVFLLGVLTHTQGLYQLHSEVTSGSGMVDVVLVPNPSIEGWEQLPAYLFELKRAQSEDTLAARAEEACAQIRNRSYGQRFQRQGYASVIGVGVAFFDQRLAFRSFVLS